MRKLIVLGAMLVMVMVAAAPALAQVGQGFSERRITSGKSSPSFSVSNKGNNVNLCPTAQQIGQTGNVANEQGVTAYQSRVDDIDFSGSELTVTPSVTAECTQTIEQAAAAGPKAEAKAGGAEAKAGEAKAGGAEAKAGGAVAAAGGAPVAAMAGGGGAPAAKAGGGMLPSTGGTASDLILALGAGGLLVGGGLMASRRFTR